MHKSATKCNETIGKWCKNKHGASKIIDTFETYQWRRPSAGCREELLDPPDLASMTAVACSMFRGKVIRPLGFSRQGEFIGERAASEGGPAGLPMWWHGQGLGCATLWGAWPLSPLHLIFGLREASVKIGGSAFISSNSENISCVTFLKHKNSRKQETPTMASC
jgi:hypothetical protein